MKANILKLLLLWESKIPQKSENILKEKLVKISPENLSAFEEIPLKNPYIALCCCVFLGIFGIEDFYRNRNTLGALKLLLTTIASLLAIVVYIIVDEFDDIYIYYVATNDFSAYYLCDDIDAYRSYLGDYQYIYHRRTHQKGQSSTYPQIHSDDRVNLRKIASDSNGDSNR